MNAYQTRHLQEICFPYIHRRENTSLFQHECQAVGQGSHASSFGGDRFQRSIFRSLHLKELKASSQQQSCGQAVQPVTT